MPAWTEEQQLAINKSNTNIIVSAGAGSGKTAVLTERVSRKLKEGIKINELLILTFTKKAAYEMKDRIRSAILEDESLKDNLSLLDSSYITTFDSFSLSIVKKYNYLLNISKNISIIDSSVLYLVKKKFIDEIFEELYESSEDFLSLIGDFTTKDDKTIKEYILTINNKLDLKYDKKEYLDNYINKYYDDNYVEELYDLYIKLIKDKTNNIKDLINELSFYTDMDYIDEVYDSLNGLLSANTYGEYRNNTLIKLPNLPKNLEEEAKNIKKSIQDEIEVIKDLTRFTSKEEIIDTYKSTDKYIKAIITIINKLDDKINAYKYEKGYYEFTDIAKLAITVVSKHEEVRDELKYFFKEIMIDEYQDTSDLQEEFINKIENNNVYMVGDIKQSIYRFGNANPYLFKEKYDKYSNNNGGFKIDLTKNFRSREEVIDNINTMFSSIMTDEVGGAAYKETHQMNFGNTSYIEEGKTNENYNMDILNYEYDKECGFTKQEIEIFAIAKDIKEKMDSKYKIFDKKKKVLRDATYNDFVILLDRSTNFDLFKKIFEYLEIPIIKYSDTNILEEVEVLLIKNIVNLIISYKEKRFDVEFKYSLTSILRSYLFSYTDEEIFDMFLNNNYLDNKAMDIIKELSIDSLSLGEIINLIIDKFDFYDKVILVGDVDKRIARIDEIEKLFLSLSTLGYDLYESYNYLTEIIEDGYEIDVKDSDDAIDSVRIMTIHASKGLEFSICYFAILDAKFNISDLNEKFLFNNTYNIVTPYFKEGIGKTFVKDLVKDKYMREEISEKIRLLYVALTRAKEKMILVTNFDKRKSKITDTRSFLDMLSLIKDDLDKFITNIDINSLNLTRDYNLIKEGNYKDSIGKTEEKITVKKYNLIEEKEDYKKASKDIKKLITKEEKDKMKFGTMMHELFEYIDFNNPDYSDIEDYYKDRISYLIDKLDISKTINIYKEYEFVYRKDNIKHHGIIDLLVEYDNSIKIIDYKLKNIDDDEYKNQLKEYKEYIERKTDKPIETYLYSIIDKELKRIDI